jgi:hypothetical protein
MCGLGPLDIDTSSKGIATRIALAIAYPLIPTILRLLFQRDPVGRVDLTDEARLELLIQQVVARKPKSPAEEIERGEVLKSHNGVLKALRSSREAFSQGFHHVGFDGQLLAGRYGFRIEDIRQDLPFQLWYGTLDATTPVNHGRQIAARLGGRAQLRVSEDTHGSLQVKYKREAWENLLKVS